MVLVAVVVNEMMMLLLLMLVVVVVLAAVAVVAIYKSRCCMARVARAARAGVATHSQGSAVTLKRQGLASVQTVVMSGLAGGLPHCTV